MDTGRLRVEPGSPSWPRRLERVESPPEELWLRGRVELLARPAGIAIVGTRAPTPYGEAQALRFAASLARHGVVVISGLARGIDAAAHGAALAAGGDTIAVLGSGVDRPWPAGPLADEMARSGLLVSEYSPGQTPRRHHFPLRNRLIAGLARAVLVVEAAWASGSLITARWAVDQGKTVFALPGRIDHPMARGCHRLIREGATLIESPEQLIADLGDGRPASVAEPVAQGGNAHGAVVIALTGETLTADELAGRLERPVREVLVDLVALELDGVVVRAPGGLYRRA